MLAVKPQVVCLACRDIATYCKSERPLVISIAAGTRIQDIQACLGDPFPVVRCMPNTPALVRAGTTGLFAGQDVSAAQRDLAQAILASVGSTLWLQQESMLDAVTAVSGSGPAYFFYLMEAMLEAAQSLGLSADQAYQLTTHTATGAAKLIKHGNQNPGELRRLSPQKEARPRLHWTSWNRAGSKNPLRRHHASRTESQTAFRDHLHHVSRLHRLRPRQVSHVCIAQYC